MTSAKDSTWSEGDLFDPQCHPAESVAIPPTHEGVLWKKSPNKLRLRKFQQRHVELAFGMLTWSAAKGALIRGKVDFSKNAVEVTTKQSSSTEFGLSPVDGKWDEGNFTGSDEGRPITFLANDATEREKWVKILKQHVAYGKNYGSRDEACAEGFADVLASSRKSVRPLWMKVGSPKEDTSFAGSVNSMETGSTTSLCEPVSRRSSRDKAGSPFMKSPAAGLLRTGRGSVPINTFFVDILNMEDPDGSYPLKECWDLKISKPPCPDRRTWQGVFKDAPKALVEGLAANARYSHIGEPLDARPGEPIPDIAANSPEDSGMLRVMEFINYYFILQGRPRCWFGGVGPAPAEMRMFQETKSGLFPGHFDNQGCFACPYGGNGGVADLLKNCWQMQATLNNGGFQWMSMTAAHNGKQFAPFTAPFGLQAVPIPPRAHRAELLHDTAYTCGATGEQLERMAEKLYVCGHGPYIITYKRPAEHIEAQERDPYYAWSKAQNQEDQVVAGNTSRVVVFPPPGMTLKGAYTGEKLGGRKGLPGEEDMANMAGVKPGSSLGGPTVKVHVYGISDRTKYQGCTNVKLVELESGEDVPAWVSDAAAPPGGDYNESALTEMMELSAAKVWLVPKGILTMGRTYQCSMTITMDNTPTDLCWSWTTFGPRVYDVPGPKPEDPARSLDWALESISDTKMKPLYRNGKPTPNVICLAAGEYFVKARYIDPGAWLHIEGAGVEDTILNIEAPDDPVIFEFPEELGPEGLQGRRTSYEYAWQNSEVPLFNMAYDYLSDKAAAHDGGGTDPGGWTPPRRVVSIIGVTLRHNVPLVIGEYGSMELVDCHVIGPHNVHRGGGPQLAHPSLSPKLRLSEVTFQPASLFDEADVNQDGVLSRSEFHALAEKQWPGLPVSDAIEYFKLADEDGRGFLSRRAFEQVYLQLVSAKPPEDPPTPKGVSSRGSEVAGGM